MEETHQIHVVYLKQQTLYLPTRTGDKEKPRSA